MIHKLKPAASSPRAIWLSDCLFGLRSYEKYYALQKKNISKDAFPSVKRDETRIEMYMPIFQLKNFCANEVCKTIKQNSVRQ